MVVNGATRQVLCTAHGRGPTHDFALYKRSGIELHESLEVLADGGYQGLSKLHGKSVTPHKKPRKAELTAEQKRSNRELASRRVVVEHVIRSLKIFRILAERYRNRRKRFSLRFKLIAGLYNYELSLGLITFARGLLFQVPALRRYGARAARSAALRPLEYLR